MAKLSVDLAVYGKLPCDLCPLQTLQLNSLILRPFHYLVFLSLVYILQAIEKWMVGRPGNETSN